MEEVNEGSDTVLTIGFKDEDGNEVTPSNVSYTIIDFFSDTVLVKEETNEPSSSTFDIELGTAANAIVNKLYAYEVRIVTAIYTYSGTKTKTDEYWYKLINMAGVPVPADEEAPP